MRKAFTLIEGLVVCTLLGIMIMMFWQAMSQGIKREGRLDFRQKAIQNAGLTLARMGDDFSQLIPVRPKVADKKIAYSVIFDRVSPDATNGPGGTPLDAGGQPVLQSVTYRHDPQRRVFLRDGHVIASGMIDDMELTYETTAAEGFQVRLDMDLVPEAELGSKTPSQKAEFGFSFFSPAGSRAMTNDSWVGDN